MTWTLTRTEGGTRLRMEQSAFKSDAEQEINGARWAWTHMFEEMQKLLAA